MKASDLISVTFTDLTNYTQPQDNSDVLGMCFNYFWGPANTPLVLNREQFLNFYPESTPLGVNYLKKPMWLYSWLSVRRAFDTGARQIECTRAVRQRKYLASFVRFDKTKYAAGMRAVKPGGSLAQYAVLELADGTILKVNDAIKGTFKQAKLVDSILLTRRSLVPTHFMRVAATASDLDLFVDTNGDEHVTMHKRTDNAVLFKDNGVFKVLSLKNDLFAGLSCENKLIALDEDKELFAYDEYADDQNASIDSDKDRFFSISLIYPGIPPAKLWGYETFEVSMLLDKPHGVPFTIQVSGLDKNGVRHVVESFSGSFKRQDETDGQTFFIEDVVNSQSAWIRMKVYAAPVDADGNEIDKFPFMFDSQTDVTGPYYPRGLVIFSLNNKEGNFRAPSSSLVEDSAYVPVPIKTTAGNANIDTVVSQWYDWVYNISSGVLGDLSKEPDENSIIGDGSVIKDAYKQIFSDFELSNATLIVPTYPESTDEEKDAYFGLHELCQDICKERSNITTVIGYPLGDNFAAKTIKQYEAEELSSRRDMFTTFIAAREYVYALGFRYLMDGIAGWAGRVCDVAKQVRVNQLPSAVTYGFYPGTLQTTLSFEEVLTLHELGIGSIYQSSVGPRIWDIRSLYERQSSYWGKYNVVRVACAILRPVMYQALRAVHRQVAADPTERRVFETSLNEIIGDFVDSRDILSDSYATCSDSNNSDIQTNGGEYLNIELDIHFIKVAERVRIHINATDSSVTASFE